MNPKRKTPPAITIALLAFGSISSGTAGVITGNLGSLPGTVSGTFPNNSTALEETFTLTSSSLITAYTTSYATGGFQPDLELFSSTGTYITSQAYSDPLAGTDPSTGLALDSYLTASLGPGSYIVLLTEFDYQLDPSVTTLTPASLFDAPIFSGFSDEDGNSATGKYSLTVTASAAPATPEPATIWLTLASVTGVFVLIRKRTGRCSTGAF